ncbi:GmrSD restriction endonuclease domain-containing protein [Corynebacterium sp. AOP40-9SA-29]|uniref:GmrSD restriction endonuclease domain-containing protein n=1 Tax=Corynebacterium sp. AOP40-9SA-29 TaxID=3457677 RepID=UPI004034B605
MSFTGRASVLAAVTATALLLAGCAGTTQDATTAAPSASSAPAAASSAASEASSPEPTTDAAATEDAGDGADAASGEPAVQDMVDMLGTLEVKGRAPKTGYSRDEFGQRWKDTDRNGCDQRNDVLARDMTDIDREGPCTVLTGTLDDPYTATTIDFLRGQDTSTAVHIDHVVALSDAWQKGAQQLSADRREEFANDHLNLLAVDGPANMQKGDGDAATWLPANRAFRCSYVATQVQVKAKYALWVTAAEHDAIARELGNCDSDGSAGLAPVEEAPEQAPAPAAEQAPAAEPAGEAGGEVYYQNCTAARAAGAAPLYRGQPGYRPQMDGDNDGIACE